MQTLSEKILNGLQRCLPETDEEGMSDCISCPYNNCCDDETEVNLPVQMVEDIRALLKAQMDPIKPVNGMPDREKVIKGLERCLICDISVIAPEEAQNAYRECEYTVGLYCGEKKLLREAVALLKEQGDTINELQNAYEYLQKQFFEVQDKLLKEQEKRIKDLQDHCDIRRSVKLNV